MVCFFFFSSRRRHTRYWRDWSSDVCSSDLRVSRSPIVIGDQNVKLTLPGGKGQLVWHLHRRGGFQGSNGERQLERNLRAVVQLALDVELAAHQLYVGIGYGQTKAGAFPRLPTGLSLCEGVEAPRKLLFADAHPCVLDGKEEGTGGRRGVVAGRARLGIRLRSPHS